MYGKMEEMIDSIAAGDKFIYLCFYDKGLPRGYYPIGKGYIVPQSLNKYNYIKKCNRNNCSKCACRVDLMELNKLLVEEDDRIIIEHGRVSRIHLNEQIYGFSFDVVQRLIEGKHKIEKKEKRGKQAMVKIADLCYSFSNLIVVGDRLRAFLERTNIINDIIYE